jgi:hypothetical protein
MAYVPPHLRRKSEAKPDGGDARDGGRRHTKENLSPDDRVIGFRQQEITSHFWPVEQGEETFDLSDKGKTLHDSADRSGKLAFVMLFAGANPQWKNEHTIYTKSSLDLLPRSSAAEADASQSNAGVGDIDSSDRAPNHDSRIQAPSNGDADDQAIAVFEQVYSNKSQSGPPYQRFRFDGWYNIENVTFLEPHSAALVKMLEKKWTKPSKFGGVKKIERDSANWKSSLSVEWAEIKLAKDEAASKELGEPQIERLPDTELASPKRSVNEMLAEMRLKDVTSSRGNEMTIADASLPPE